MPMNRAVNERTDASLVSYANSLRQNHELEEARMHLDHALKTDPNCWQAHLGMSAVLADLGNIAGAARHRRAAFHGRCVVPLAYRGDKPPITVLELIAIGPGNARLKLFLSDRIYKRYLVATEFFDCATPLPPH